MEKIKIKIKPSDLHLRNVMHFQVQLNNRVLIRNSKKEYNRSALKRATRQAVYEC